MHSPVSCTEQRDLEETQVLCRFPQEMVPFYRLFCGQGTEALPKGRGHAPAAPGWPSVSSGTGTERRPYLPGQRGRRGERGMAAFTCVKAGGIKGDVDAVPRFHDHIFFPALVHETEFPGREALAVALMPPSFQDRLTVRPPRVRSPVAEPSVHESASAGASMMTR